MRDLPTAQTVRSQVIWEHSAPALRAIGLALGHDCWKIGRWLPAAIEVHPPEPKHGPLPAA